MVLFDNTWRPDLVCIMWIPNMLRSIFINSCILQEGTLLAVHSYIWFDFVVFGFFGMNGTNNCSLIHCLTCDLAFLHVQLLEKVKINSLTWLKAKNVCFIFGYHMWWQQLLVCLGIGWLLFTIILMEIIFRYFYRLPRLFVAYLRPKWHLTLY